MNQKSHEMVQLSYKKNFKAVAQKTRKLQPLAPKHVRGSGGRIFEDRGPKLEAQRLIHLLPTILYSCVIVIGGRLHAVNRDLN